MELSKQLTGVSKARTLSRPEQTMINDSVSISTVLKALANLLRRLSVARFCNDLETNSIVGLIFFWRTFLKGEKSGQICNHLARVLRKRGVDSIYHNMPSSALELGSIRRAAWKCKCLRTMLNKRCRRVNLCRVDFFDLMFIQHDWCETSGCSCLILGPGIAGCR